MYASYEMRPCLNFSFASNAASLNYYKEMCAAWPVKIEQFTIFGPAGGKLASHIMSCNK